MNTVKKMMVVFVGLFVFAFLTAQAEGDKKIENKYVGVKMCSMCHKTDKQGKQLDIWQKSKHSGAFQTLLSEKALAIAKEKKLEKAPSETAECLSCHTAANGVDAKLLDKGFEMKDGVQCEACHGAGSAYKGPAIMKDKEKAVAAGLKIYKDDKEIEAVCKTCHNEKSPTYKEFKFAERWAKIKHSIPKEVKK
jgi:mono/diheme cytochrome c family protein